MSGVRWCRLPQMVAVPALAALALAGCSPGSPAPQATQPADGSAASTTTRASFTAAQLRGALLTKINGQSPAVPVESGAYGSLAQVKATRNSTNGVTVSPAECAQTTVTGFSSPSFATVPATVSTFRVGSNGISEVLLAPAAATAALALGKQLPARCARYTATVKGKTFVYTVSEQAVRNLGQQARAINVRATGSGSIDVWSVVYRATGFVGAVTIVGPDASANVVTALAAQAYAHAAKSLR